MTERPSDRARPAREATSRARPAPSARTRVRRHSDRAAYDPATIDAILDAGFLCHVAVIEDGAPRIVPMIYGRWRDRLVLHGALANQLLRQGVAAEVCVSVTVVDEVVVARSAMHHSLNYRSVVAFGTLEEITDPAAKVEALATVVNQALPGRAADARGPNDAELRATRVASMVLSEVSAKVRAGPPIDDPIDDGLAVWSGVVPLTTVAEAPRSAPDLSAGTIPPAHIVVRGAQPRR